jgi:hypothetical protein
MKLFVTLALILGLFVLVPVGCGHVETVEGAACVCEEGKAGKAVFCAACEKGYVEGKVAGKCCVTAAVAGKNCGSCAKE